MTPKEWAESLWKTRDYEFYEDHMVKPKEPVIPEIIVRIFANNLETKRVTHDGQIYYRDSQAVLLYEKANPIGLTWFKSLSPKPGPVSVTVVNNLIDEAAQDGPIATALTRRFNKASFAKTRYEL